MKYYYYSPILLFLLIFNISCTDTNKGVTASKIKIKYTQIDNLDSTSYIQIDTLRIYHTSDFKKIRQGYFLPAHKVILYGSKDKGVMQKTKASMIVQQLAMILTKARKYSIDSTYILENKGEILLMRNDNKNLTISFSENYPITYELN